MDLSKLSEVYSTAVLTKAEKLIEDGGVSIDNEHPSIYWVKGSTGNRYRVQVIDPFDEDETIGELDHAEVLPFVTCTCPNGLASGGRARCFHSAGVVAIMMGLADES
jgi:hypothetical protein